jgi:hypothetical protein
MTTTKGPKLTIALGDEDAPLHDALRQLAAERGQSLQALLLQALREWVEQQEESEDLTAIAEAKSEAHGAPTSSWKQVKAEMDEARAARRAE